MSCNRFRSTRSPTNTRDGIESIPNVVDSRGSRGPRGDNAAVEVEIAPPNTATQSPLPPLAATTMTPPDAAGERTDAAAAAGAGASR